MINSDLPWDCIGLLRGLTQLTWRYSQPRLLWLWYYGTTRQDLRLSRRGLQLCAHWNVHRVIAWVWIATGPCIFVTISSSRLGCDRYKSSSDSNRGWTLVGFLINTDQLVNSFRGNSKLALSLIILSSFGERYKRSEIEQMFFWVVCCPSSEEIWIKCSV